MQRMHCLAFGLFFLAFAGCGSADRGRRVPVEGKITANGKPLDGALVQLLPLGSAKGDGGFAPSDSDGNFKMSVLPGHYKVRIHRYAMVDGTLCPPDIKTVERPDCKESVPREYADPQLTPLKCTVPEEGLTAQVFNIPVEIKRGK